MANEQKFRFDGLACMLTYKTHLPKPEFTEWLELTCMPAHTFSFLRMAHETGDESHAYLHTHVVFRVSKRFQTENCRFWDYQGIHPNIKKIDCRGKHFKNSQKYLAKEDTANADLLEEENTVSKVERYWECETVGEALMRHMKKASDAPGIIAAFGKKPLPEWEMEWEPRIWQKQLHDRIGPDVVYDGRKVIWIYDKVGNVGKTYMMKYYNHMWPKLYAGTAGPITYYHFATIVQGFFTQGWTGHCCFFNIMRGAQDLSGVYSCLESAADGLVTSQKYSGTTMNWPGAHVVVFANWLPPEPEEVSYLDSEGNYHTEVRSVLSEDRWDIYMIPDAKGPLVPRARGGLNINSPPPERAPSARDLKDE